MSKEVKITCKGASLLPLEQLTEFQGELKDLTFENFEKLKRNILKDGFNNPINVWQNEGKNYILDGTQRNRVLLKLQEEGYVIPPLPVDFVEARDVTHAKGLLLSHAAAYGHVTRQGLYQYIEENNLSFEEVKANYSFPEVEFESFETEFYSDEIKTDEPIKEKELDENIETKNECPSCGYVW